MRTELVAQALNNAAATTLIEPDAVFHSDRGSVYTSADYRALVTDLGMRSSMGRTGVCWDCQSVSVGSDLDSEVLAVAAGLAPERMWKIAIGHWIENRNSPPRRHTSNGQINYVMFEMQHFNQNAAVQRAA